MQKTSQTLSYRYILGIAFPIILGSLAQNVIALADTMFLGHYGEIYLAAGSLASVFYQVVVMFLTGFGIGTQITMAHRMGEGRPGSIGRIFYHSVWFMLFAAVLLFTLFRFFGQNLLQELIQTPDVRMAVNEFLQVRMFGLPFAFIALSFNAFYVGTARTKTISIATLTMGAVNVLLDYLLVFGIGPFPEMGMRGAALASVIAEGVGLCVYLVASYRHLPNREKFRLFEKFSLHPKLFGKMLNISYPIMLEYLIGFGNYFVFFLMIERLGQHTLALANITRSLYTIFLIPIWGFTATVSSLTAFLCGQKKEEDIPRLVKRCILLGCISIGIIIIPYLCIHPWVLSCFTDNQQLIREAFVPSLVAMGATFTMLLGQMIFNSILGRGKTTQGFFIEILTLFIYLAYSYYVIVVLRSSVATAFTGEFVYTLVLALFSVIYLRFMHQKKCSI